MAAGERLSAWGRMRQQRRDEARRRVLAAREKEAEHSFRPDLSAVRRLAQHAARARQVRRVAPLRAPRSLPLLLLLLLLLLLRLL